MPQEDIDFVVYQTATGIRVNSMGRVLRQAHIKTVSNGGMSDLTGIVDRSIRLAYADLLFGTEIRAVDNQGVFYRGRADQQAGQLTQTSENIQMTWLNTSAEDQNTDPITVTNGTSIEAAFGQVFNSTWTPLIGSNTRFVTTGNGVHADTVFTDKHPRDIANELSKLGGSSNRPLIWGVWPDGPSFAYQAQLAFRPITPTYQIDIRNFGGQIGYDATAYFNRQRVRYANGVSLSTQNNFPAQSAPPVGVGYIRDGDVIQASNITSSLDADAIGLTALTLGVQQRITSRGGLISIPWAIRDTQGQIVPLWRVRAGTNLAINGVQPVNTNYSLSRNMLYIVSTDYDVDKQTLTLTFENYKQTIQGITTLLLLSQGL